MQWVILIEFKILKENKERGEPISDSQNLQIVVLVWLSFKSRFVGIQTEKY